MRTQDKIFEDTRKDGIFFTSFAITVIMLILFFSIFMLTSTYGFISLLWIGNLWLVWLLWIFLFENRR